MKLQEVAKLKDVSQNQYLKLISRLIIQKEYDFCYQLFDAFCLENKLYNYNGIELFVSIDYTIQSVKLNGDLASCFINWAMLLKNIENIEIQYIIVNK